MSAILSAFTDHPKMIATVACCILVLLCGIAVYRAGGNATASRMQAAQAQAMHRAESAMAAANARLEPIKRENDSLHVRNASLEARSDSLDKVVETKRTQARTVNDRLVLHGDTARVETDTGVVAIQIPHDLTRQLAAMQLNNDSLVMAMDRRHEADTTRILGLTEENAGLRLQIEMDSSIDVDFRKQLAAAEKRVAAAEAKPKHSTVVAFIGGAVVALAGVVTLAVVF